MWISSIKLKNFKSYENANFSFPEPMKNKNLVLIGAKNGHGKTTLLEAIYLGMYDKDAISHLDRAGLTEQKPYKEYLSSALYHQAPTAHNQYTIEISIDIMKRDSKNEIEGIRISRKWHFDKYRQLILDNNEEIILKLDSKLEGTPLQKDDANLLFNSHALPIDYAPFFFFDGEKIVSTARSTGAGVWLNKALRGLLGVTLLDQLKVSLKDYEDQNFKESASKKVQNQITEIDNKLNLIQKNIDIYSHQLSEATANRERLQIESDQILKILGSGTDIQSSQEIINKIQNVESNYEETKQNVKSAISSMALSFLPRLELNSLVEKLDQEKNRLNHEAGKGQIEGKVDEFWRQFVESDKVREVLGRSAEAILNDELMKQAVQECWELLYYPLPAGCAEKITHNYLSQTAHSKISTQFEQLNNQVGTSDSISKLILQMDQDKHEKEKFESQLNDIKANGSDDKIERLKLVRDESAEIDMKVGIAQDNLIREQNLKDNTAQEKEKLSKQISDSNPKKKKAQRAKVVQIMIDSLKNRLMTSKTSEVAVEATKINHKIAHDDRISKITIDKQGQMRLLGENQKEMNVDLSAGQIQVLMMSLISAMAEVTHYKVPFVIDTPLARLDEEHRQGIFEHWISLKQQVILLSQDSEINGDVMHELKPYINKTYLVSAQSLPTGGAHSSIEENSYFELRK